MSLVAELQRRNVFRVALAYLAASWLLVQIADTIFPLFGLPESSARLIVVVLAIGFVPTLVVSWFYELTPEGLKLDSEIERDTSIRPQSGRRLDRIISVVLAIALVFFAFDKFVLSESRIESAREAGRSEGLIESFGDKSIAVLPFADMSASRDQRYMSEGIAEELLNLLAKIPDLRVISRSSAFSFQDSNLDVRSIAERLEVTYVLEGSVRTSGSRIRITSQLVDARSDTHLWSETYERELDDIFAIQDDIAAAVVSNLKVALLDDGVTTADPEAYALFLRGRYLHENPTAEGFEMALAAYRGAVEVDDGYAPAWVWLAALYDDMETTADHGYEEVGVLAKEAIDRALAIDPDYALAFAMRALVTNEWDQDLERSTADMQRALELDPANPIILRWAGLQLMWLSRYDDSVLVFEHLFSRDPLGWITRFNLVISYSLAGQYEEAIGLSETMLTVRPNAGRLRYILALSYLFSGDPAAAMEQADRQSRDVRREVIAAMAAGALGQQAAYEESLAALERRYSAGDLSTSHEIAMVHAYSGDTDTAIDWLERGLDDGESRLAPADAELPGLHDHPRWPELMRRIETELGLRTDLDLELPLNIARP